MTQNDDSWQNSQPFGVDNPAYAISDAELALFKRLLAEGHDIEYTQFVDGIGHGMWFVNSHAGDTLEQALDHWQSGN